MNYRLGKNPYRSSSITSDDTSSRRESVSSQLPDACCRDRSTNQPTRGGVKWAAFDGRLPAIGLAFPRTPTRADTMRFLPLPPLSCIVCSVDLVRNVHRRLGQAPYECQHAQSVS